MYFLPFATSLVAAALIWQWIYDPNLWIPELRLVVRRHSTPEVVAESVPGAPVHRSVSVWVRIGFDTMIFLAALQSIPQEYYERPTSTAQAPLNGSGTSPCRC